MASRQGSWGFKQDSIVAKEIVNALPVIEFRQDLRTPNALQVAQQHGPFRDYHDIPEDPPVFPESVMDFLRALAALQDGDNNTDCDPRLDDDNDSSRSSCSGGGGLGERTKGNWHVGQDGDGARHLPRRSRS